MKTLNFTIIFAFLLLGSMVSAQPFTVYINTQVSQYQFVASDIQKVLKAKGLESEIVDIRQLTPNNSESKVIIALQSDSVILSMMKANGAETLPELGEQAFAIRSTGSSKKSFWITGGDVNGAMYGGMQLAEQFQLRGVNEEVNEEQSPYLLNRGIKFNIPFDKRSPTYYGSGFSENDFRGSSTKKAIEHIWNLDFWADMFDEWARQRYNALSLWSLHPCTSMIKLDDYPEVAIENVQGFEGFNKSMAIDEKIDFWKKVMLLAKNRGFEFYIYNWNIYTYGASGKYGIDNNARNPNTIEYMRKCMTRLFETYPDLTGFGVTAGENMGGISDEEEAQWTWKTYGQGVIDFASANPGREVVFIHRYHGAGGAEVAANFESLHKLPNVRFDFSFKYAVAHIYSTTTPDWIRTRNGDVPAQLSQLELKTWLELRNDSFHYLHWGDPDFVKSYLAGFPDKDLYIRGFFMGSDGYTPTYVFTSKAEWTDGMLDIQRNWYTWMLWGRLAYNPNLKDAFFNDVLAYRYPDSQNLRLFEAWKEASAGIPLFTELIQGTLISDFKWYPETCMSRKDGFVTIGKMIEAVPPPGSDKCSIAETIAGGCIGKIGSFEVADMIDEHARKALQLIGKSEIDLTTELGTNQGNILAMAYLSLYFAEKTRGATYFAALQKQEAKEAMGRAWLHWQQYSSLMDQLFTGMDLQRTRTITTWSELDSEVFKEYTLLGGS